MIRLRHVARPLAALAAAVCAGVTAAWAGSAETRAMDQPHKPFKIYGNTFYVGSAGHSSVLISSDYGSVLVDTGPKEIAAQVAANIEALGFKLGEVKAIVVSDARPEHSGGVGELVKLTGAQVYTMRPGDQKLRGSIKPPKDDPREGVNMGSLPLVPQVWVVQDDQLLGIASVRLRALATTAGAPEGVSWSWDACDGSKCLATIYAASLAPEAGGKGGSKGHPDAHQALDASLARLDGAACQLLLTPDPDESGGLERLEKADGKEDALKNDSACKTYVLQQKQRLALKQPVK
jgi:metallo-beta-lactamase class B